MVRHGSIHSGVEPIDTLELTKNQVLFHQGDSADHWYEVVSGVVRTCRFLVDGQRHLTGFYFPGDVIGTGSSHFPACAETVTSATLRSHVRGSVNDASPDSSVIFVEGALRSAERCVALLGHRSAMERLSAFILQIARKQQLSNRIPLPMSRIDIADHLGLTIHTVSRLFTELARRRIVVADGRFHLQILGSEALAALAGEVVTPALQSTPFTEAGAASC